MIEAGVDLWGGQEMNDFYKLATMYKDSNIAFVVQAPLPHPEGRTEEENMQLAKKFLDKYEDCKIAIKGGIVTPYKLIFNR